MLCARRTVLLHARRHHSFSSSDIRSDVARAEDRVAEETRRAVEAEMEPMRHRLKKIEEEASKMDITLWTMAGRGEAYDCRLDFWRFVVFILVVMQLYKSCTDDEDKQGKNNDDEDKHRKRCSHPYCTFPREGPLFVGTVDAVTGELKKEDYRHSRDCPFWSKEEKSSQP